MSRRLLCSAVPAVALMPVTALANPIAHPDAELIAIGREALPLIAEYERFTADLYALPSDHPDFNRVADLALPASDRLDQLWDQVILMQATTPEGHRVKAAFLQHEMRCTYRIAGVMTFENPAQEMAWSLVCDMLTNGDVA
jgi:hypothetical protein